ncbi:30S ribosomal protein S9 [Spirochaeta dissipatitropha]
MSVYVSQGTGRRKTSVARVYLKNGSGDIQVNGKNLDDYFNTKEQSYIVRQALVVTDNEKKFDIKVNVFGGGKSGQAGAILHGLARALVSVDEENLKSLRANGFMSRDSRMVERKKYGQPGARRKFQFSKR